MDTGYESDRIVIHRIKRTRDRAKRSWMEAMKKEMGSLNLTMEMVINHDEWKKRSDSFEPKS